MPRFYAYILRSSKSKIFYYDHTEKLPRVRTTEHNDGIMKSTKPHVPWKLVWYGAFETLKQAKDFELYLKNGSGKAFAYKRLVNVALNRDVSG